MLVTIKGKSRPVDLPTKAAKTLIKKGLAEETTEHEPEVTGPVAMDSENVGEIGPAEAVEISPRTGLPKRQYRRRDMQAED